MLKARVLRHPIPSVMEALIVEITALEMIEAIRKMDELVAKGHEFDFMSYRTCVAGCYYGDYRNSKAYAMSKLIEGAAYMPLEEKDKPAAMLNWPLTRQAIIDTYQLEI
jgi:hypothetical protein